jgi:hypothetical protein
MTIDGVGVREEEMAARVPSKRRNGCLPSIFVVASALEPSVSAVS